MSATRAGRAVTWGASAASWCIETAWSGEGMGDWKRGLSWACVPCRLSSYARWTCSKHRTAKWTLRVAPTRRHAVLAASARQRGADFPLFPHLFSTCLSFSYRRFEDGWVHCRFSCWDSFPPGRLTYGPRSLYSVDNSWFVRSSYVASRKRCDGPLVGM
jgi:hypothetical protein